MAIEKPVITKASIEKLNDLKQHLNLSNDEVMSVLNFIKLLKANKNASGNNDLNLLTEREREVFNLVLSGLKTREIADVLNISYGTVTTHRKNIKSKLKFDDIIDWYNTYSYDLYQKQIS